MKMFFIQIDVLVILKHNEHGLMFASEARNILFSIGDFHWICSGLSLKY
jgi:hypothetical protein